MFGQCVCVCVCCVRFCICKCASDLKSCYGFGPLDFHIGSMSRLCTHAQLCVCVCVLLRVLMCMQAWKRGTRSCFKTCLKKPTFHHRLQNNHSIHNSAHAIPLETHIPCSSCASYGRTSSSATSKYSSSKSSSRSESRGR